MTRELVKKAKAISLDKKKGHDFLCPPHGQIEVTEHRSGAASVSCRSCRRSLIELPSGQLTGSALSSPVCRA